MPSSQVVDFIPRGRVWTKPIIVHVDSVDRRRAIPVADVGIRYRLNVPQTKADATHSMTRAFL